MNKLIISNKIKIFINIYCLILNQISFKINVLILTLSVVNYLSFAILKTLQFNWKYDCNYDLAILCKLLYIYN